MIMGDAMKRLILTAALFLFTLSAQAASFEYKIFFGLSKAEGAVSLKEWEAYEAGFAKQFFGFTVTPATGFYKGAKERSRLITLYMDACREPELTAEIQRYVTAFGQDSVLLAKSRLESLDLVGATGSEPLVDSCTVPAE